MGKPITRQGLDKMAICVMCGNDYKSTGNNQIRCNDCRILYKKEYNKRYTKRYRVSGVGSGNNQSGENNHNWNGGTSKYKEIKLSSMDTYKCERCNKDLNQFIGKGRNGMWCIHHKDYNRKNPSLDNLELLCKRCHQLEHKCYNNLSN
jgi:DNA-directed RNA polymerase subunit RPC12/RpoP